MADEAVDRAGRWMPDLIVSEHCDLVGPLVASACEVPCVVAVTGTALEPDEVDALTATVRTRYLDRGLQPPPQAPDGRPLLHLSPPSLRPQWPAADRRHDATRAEPGPAPARLSLARRRRATLSTGRRAGHIPCAAPRPPKN
jgi:L-noviosyl transferase